MHWFTHIAGMTRLKFKCVFVCICFFSPTVSSYLKSSLRESSGINSLLFLHKLITVGRADSHTLRPTDVFYFLPHLHPRASYNQTKFHFSLNRPVLKSGIKKEQYNYCNELSLLFSRLLYWDFCKVLKETAAAFMFKRLFADR